MRHSIRSARNPFYLCLALVLLGAIASVSAGPALAGTAPSDEVAAPAVTADGSEPIAATSDPSPVSSSEITAAELEAVADWGGPEAPLVQEIEVELMSGSDCDSPQGYCSSSAQCWSFCRALTGEIGFCNQIYNCCVCPEIPGF